MFYNLNLFTSLLEASVFSSEVEAFVGDWYAAFLDGLDLSGFIPKYNVFFFFAEEIFESAAT